MEKKYLKGLNVRIRVNGLDGFIEKLKELQNLIHEINNEALEVEINYQGSLEDKKCSIAESNIDSQD